MIAAGRGRPVPSPSAQLIAAPWEKPPSTTRSIGTDRPSRNLRRPAERREERLGIGRRDASQPVPVGAARRQRQRASRRDPEQTPLRVERVEKGVEIVLIGAAAVEEDERTLRLARRRPVDESERLAHTVVHEALGSGSGVRTGSICKRRCSNAGGRISDSPRCSGSSSIEKPGPRVAISNSTPLGSRK